MTSQTHLLFSVMGCMANRERARLLDSDDDDLEACFIGESHKIVMVGDKAVGKSELAKCFAGSVFDPRYHPTIGVEFVSHLIHVDENLIKYQVWDTAGEARFRNIVEAYYRGAMGFLIVYNTTKKETFDKVPYWLQRIRSLCFQSDVPVMLIGSQGDLDDARTVDYLTAKEYADAEGLQLFETSAKDGTNVELALVTMSAMIKQSN